MPRFFKLILVWIIVVLPFGASLLHAWWIDDPAKVCADPADQIHSRCVVTDDGFVIVVWEDERNGNFDIYAQKLDTLGTDQWALEGVPVCTAPGPQHDIELIDDGAGGVIAVWQDARNSSGVDLWDVYAQRLDAAGNPVWTADGISVTPWDYSQICPRLVSDGSGGAIVAWVDDYNGDWDISARRVDGSGANVWAYAQVVVERTGDQDSVRVISDGAGGAIFAWQDTRGGDLDIYAQRLLADGSNAWTGNGVPACTAALYQRDPEIVADGAGGAIIAWRDNRDGVNTKVVVQRLDAGGNALWTVDGVEIDDFSDYLNLTTNCAGGAILTWGVAKTTAIDADGAIYWGGGGFVLADSDLGSPLYPRVCSDGDGGAFVAWMDLRDDISLDIYAQHLDSEGNITSQCPGGVPIATGEGVHQAEPYIVPDGRYGAYLTWYDRPYTAHDIMLQRLDLWGFRGYNKARVLSAGDIPADEGGYARIEIFSANHDWQQDRDHTVSGYNIWRRVDSKAAARSPERQVPGIPADRGLLHELITDPARSIGLVLPGEAASAMGLPPGDWESLGFHAAMHELHVDFVIPTATDSTSDGIPWLHYCISTHTPDPWEFWVTGADSCYSVDNLAPAMPVAFTGQMEYEPAGLRLTWDANGEVDLTGYRVHRGAEEFFVPDASNLLVFTVATECFDGEGDSGSGFHYKVAAVDRHDNKSSFAHLGPAAIAGVRPQQVPAASFLSQNFPNPFNPQTTIAFDLSKQTAVDLRVFDVSGRLVKELVGGGIMEQGRHEVTWNGRDIQGRQMPSGTYFYRLQAGEYVKTKRMTLLK